MPICYERWCHQYSEAGQSSQKTSLWIKAILIENDHSHTERDSCGTDGEGRDWHRHRGGASAGTGGPVQGGPGGNRGRKDF